MGTLKIFGKGFEAANKRARLLIYLWLTNFTFSLVLAAPFYFLLNKDFSHSMLGEKLFQGQDFLWWGDLIYKYQDMFALFVNWLIVPAILYLILQAFLNGGILGRLSTEEKASFPGFLADGARYFWRFLRVLLISLIGYVLVFILLGRGISALFRLWTKNASSQWTTLIASSLRLVVFLLLFSIVKMFFDYVKVSLVAAGNKRTIRATLANFGFLGKRFFRAWGLFLLVGLIFVVLTLINYYAARLLPQTGLFLFIILFLWQQAYILARVWTSVLFFSTEYQFFKAQKSFSA